RGANGVVIAGGGSPGLLQLNGPGLPPPAITGDRASHAGVVFDTPCGGVTAAFVLRSASSVRSVTRSTSEIVVMPARIFSIPSSRSVLMPDWIAASLISLAV